MPMVMDGDKEVFTKLEISPEEAEDGFTLQAVSASLIIGTSGIYVRTVIKCKGNHLDHSLKILEVDPTVALETIRDDPQKRQLLPDKIPFFIKLRVEETIWCMPSIVLKETGILLTESQQASILSISRKPILFYG